MTPEKPSYLALVDRPKHMTITDILWFKQWISKLQRQGLRSEPDILELVIVNLSAYASSPPALATNNGHLRLNACEN